MEDEGIDKYKYNSPESKMISVLRNRNYL